MWVISNFILVALVILNNNNIHIGGKRIQRRCRLERGEMVFANKSYCSFCYMSIAKMNKNTVAINMTIDVIKEIPENAMFSFVVNKFDAGAYKRTAMQFTQTLCHTLIYKYPVVYGKYIENGILKNFLKPSCPVPPGHYYILNADFPDSNIGFLPLWRGEVEVKVYTPEFSLLHIYLYLRIVEEYM